MRGGKSSFGGLYLLCRRALDAFVCANEQQQQWEWVGGRDCLSSWLAYQDRWLVVGWTLLGETEWGYIERELCV